MLHIRQTSAWHPACKKMGDGGGGHCLVQMEWRPAGWSTVARQSRKTNKHPFHSLFSTTSWVIVQEKSAKILWILIKQETTRWEWHQLDNMQIVCCSRQITTPAPQCFTGQSTLSKYWRQTPHLKPEITQKPRTSQNHHHNHFTALFPGPPTSAGARRELLDIMVQGKINRGRHTDHPAGCHSSGLSSAHLHLSLILYRPDALPTAQPAVLKHWRLKEISRPLHYEF